MTAKNYQYLALGDSYTIGEGVPLHNSFPYITVQLLREKGWAFSAPEIIAKTGWTTGELIEQLNETKLLNQYDFATILIGVNNQYRGLSIDDYKREFTFLLQDALLYVDNKTKHLIVLSIPHWQLTPFAKGRDIETIEQEINVFNSVNKQIAEQAGVGYIDIAPGTKEVSLHTELVTADHLHYSAIEHTRWAKAIVDYLTKVLP